MTDKLFDDTERFEMRPAQYSEGQFEYINISNRGHYQKVRNELEVWYKEYLKYNNSSAKDVRSRFRSKADDQHLSALTELTLHHLLLKDGYLPQAHPELPDVKTRPEFLVLQDNKPKFIVEAVLVYPDRATSRTDKFESEIFDAVNKVISPDFLISLEIESRDPSTQPKIGKVVSDIQQHINQLDYATVCSKYESTQTLPECIITQNDWVFKCLFSPVTEEGRLIRNADSRNIGATVHGASLVEIDEAIRDNVLEKGKKYGKFDIPFVIMVNVIRESIYCDDDTVLDALLGKQVVDYITYKDGTHKIQPRRNLEGIWTEPKKGLTNEHISGVIIVSGLYSSTIETANPVLWHHPKATHPLSREALSIDQRYFENGELKQIKS